jgi:hypothetical protein
MGIPLSSPVGNNLIVEPLLPASLERKFEGVELDGGLISSSVGVPKYDGGASAELKR